MSYLLFETPRGYYSNIVCPRFGSDVCGGRRGKWLKVSDNLIQYNYKSFLWRDSGSVPR